MATAALYRGRARWPTRLVGCVGWRHPRPTAPPAFPRKTGGGAVDRPAAGVARGGVGGTRVIGGAGGAGKSSRPSPNVPRPRLMVCTRQRKAVRGCRDCVMVRQGWGWRDAKGRRKEGGRAEPSKKNKRTQAVFFFTQPHRPLFPSPDHSPPPSPPPHRPCRGASKPTPSRGTRCTPNFVAAASAMEAIFFSSS